MNQTHQKQLERNIIKFSWYKIFTKRVYLPLITIQLVSVGKVTVAQLALISAITVVTSLLLELPTGFFADKYGNRTSILVGCSIALTSPLFYVFFPNFFGGLVASILFFGGYSFQSGAIEAFMHDTLVALKREEDYSKIMGRAQSYGLLGSVVLLIAVPATYSINHALPFILGFFSLLAMFTLALTFTYPPRATVVKTRNPFAATRTIITRENFGLLVFAGVSLGVSYTGGNYRELLWQHLGIAVGLFGTLVAIGSVIGAVLGRFLHVIDRLKPSTFYLFDILFMSGFLVLAGATTNRLIAIVAFVMLAGYDRVHLILFQSKLLRDLHHTYKATLLSSLNLFSTLSQALAAVALGKFIGFKGYEGGYVLFGLLVLAVGLVLYLMATTALKEQALLDPDHF